MTETESSENDPAREQPAARPAALGFFSMRKKILNPAFPAPILLIPQHDHLVVLSLYLSLRFFTRDNPNELLQASFHAKSFHNGTDTRKQYVFHKTCTDLAKLLLPPFIVQNKRTILSTNKSKDLHYPPLRTFRRQKTEKIPERLAYVYSGHLRGGEKILAARSSGGRDRRRVTNPESEER